MAAAPVIGAGLGVFGALSGASQQRGQIAAQQQQIEYEAQALEAKAKDLVYEGGLQEQYVRRQAKGNEGRMVASAAGSGVVVSTGSVLDAIKENAFNIEMDALTERGNYERQAKATWQQAQNVRAGSPRQASGIGTLIGAAGAGLGGYAAGLSIAG